MRASFIFFLLLLLCSLAYGQGNIISVNNNAAAGADFTNLQTAIDSAEAGDVIYVYPSGSSYGSITINKPLTFYGPGYDIQSNPSLEISSFFGNSILSTVTINAAASGTKMSGLQINYINATDTQNLEISRCKITNRLYLTGGGNARFSSNYFTAGYLGGNTNHMSLSGVVNAIIDHNIFVGWDQYSSGLGGAPQSSSYNRTDNLSVYGSSGVSIEHNFFRDRIFAVSSSITNNIFWHSTDAASSGFNADAPIVGSGNSVLHNIMNYSHDYGVTNIVGVPREEMFAGYPVLGNSSFDSLYELSPNSPARGAGTNGTDCGPFGGDTPYQLSGLPPIPLIYDIQAPATGTAAQGLQVTIKARAID